MSDFSRSLRSRRRQWLRYRKILLFLVYGFASPEPQLVLMVLPEVKPRLRWVATYYRYTLLLPPLLDHLSLVEVEVDEQEDANDDDEGAERDGNEDEPPRALLLFFSSFRFASLRELLRLDFVVERSLVRGSRRVENGNVSACPELLLRTAAYLPRSVGAHPPVIT